MAGKRVFHITEELARRLEDFRYAHRIPSESEAIRRLMEIGLDTVEKAKDEKGRRK